MAGLWAGVGACGLEESADFLVGRPCEPLAFECDPDQRCLPHTLDGEVYSRFLCRDSDSFETPIGEQLRAFCDENRGYRCPGTLQCRPDRIREGEPVRAAICKFPDDPFGPPADPSTDGREAG